MQQLSYDAAILGGGPAGSTAAIALAGKGRRVIVLERDRFPRFHIGESLLPYSMEAFDRLGIRDRLPPITFPKHGGEIATSCGQRALKFYFKNGFRLKHHEAVQVERATFDQLLLDRAREVGAEVREETKVESIDLDAGGAAITARFGQDSFTIRAQYVIDATGRSSLLGTKLGLKDSYPHLQKFSCFAHYEDVQRDEGIDAGLTRLIRAADHWFWMIPLDATRTSVGVVMDLADFRTAKLTPEQMLQHVIEDSPLVSMRMKDAVRVSEVHSAGDYSYRNRQLTGERWMLAGDAAGFIDPIFSTGVFLAIHSGEQCAAAIDRSLSRPGSRTRLFRKYERETHKIMDMYLRFVSAWYRPEFIEVFTTPTQRLQLAPAINAVLAGNLGNSFAIWWRMQVFYLVLFLQRFVTLCPRLEQRPLSSPSERLQTAA